MILRPADIKISVKSKELIDMGKNSKDKNQLIKKLYTSFNYELTSNETESFLGTYTTIADGANGQLFLDTSLYTRNIFMLAVNYESNGDWPIFFSFNAGTSFEYTLMQPRAGFLIQPVGYDIGSSSVIYKTGDQFMVFDGVGGQQINYYAIYSLVT